MAHSFVSKQLYGGAIVVDLPADFLDASDLRQVPDHQEVFLSQQTLTSIIFEINEYQPTTSVDVHSNIRRVNSHTPSEDEAASTHHFLDLITPPDKIDPDSITIKPPRVHLTQPSTSKFPAYTQTGTSLGQEIDRNKRSLLPPDWQGDPPSLTTETRIFQLLIRMRDYETDFCVRVNIPLKELGINPTAELELGESIIQRVIQSLEIKDFGLFGVNN